MFRNEKSNQMVANPDVRVRLTHDVYVSPIEFDPGQPPEGTTTELAKGETVTVGPLAVTFAAFDMGGDHSGGGMNTIGARLAVRHGDTTVNVTPSVVPGENGFVPVPAAIPGLDGATVELIGINAGVGRIRLHFHGVGGSGVARRAQLKEGEAISYGGVELTFDGFDLSDFDPEAGRIHIGAAFKTAGYGKPGETITAFYRSDPSGGERWEDAAVPGLPGVSLRLGRMDAENKVLEALVIDPSAPADPGQPMRFSVDFSLKPMIVLLWTGLVVLLTGGVMAVFRRTAEFTVATAGEAG
jgi:cytochrome c-type biogenesis protein CcmF